MPIYQPSSRLLVIGLDGGTWDILGPLCELGEMPNLARLRNQGAWSELLSTQPPFTAPAWATFATGVNPGKHSVLSFTQKSAHPARSLRNDGAPVNSTNIRAPILWEYFNQAGRKVGSINLPLSYPLRPIDDFAISGMLTPPGVNDWIIPNELAADLQGYVIELDYGRPGKTLAAQDLPAPGQMLLDISKMTERRGFHALRLIQKRPWDVFTVIFTGTDRIFHHFWHYLQPGSIESPDRLEIAVSEQMQKYFRLLDSIIGSLVRSAGKDTTVVIVSDHGFGPAARHWAHLNNWLLEIDLLRFKSAGSGGWLHRLRHRSPWLTDVAKRILPPEARDAVRQYGHLADAIDWRHTLAWAEPLYNNVAGIRLHSADRYPGGPVSPGAVKQLRQTLIEEARNLRIPGTEDALVIDIQEREQLYRGPYTDQFPDLILTLDPDYVAVPTLGTTLITPIPQLLRTGDHRPEGIFVAAGPNVHPGRLPIPPGLQDIAPTLLHFADIPTPEIMDGRVVTEAFSDGYLVLHPPRRGDNLTSPPPEQPLSEEDAEAVADRLRGLGYLEE